MLTAGDLVKIDFGTPGSDVAQGMTQVTPADALTPSSDYGFIASESMGRQGVDRQGYWGPHSRDFVEADQLTYAVRLHARAVYRVFYAFGDPLTNRSQDVSIEGQFVETASLQPFDFHRATQFVEVSDDGILELTVTSRTSEPALLNLLIVALVSMPPDDSGDDPPPDDGGDDPPPDDDGGSPSGNLTYRLDFGTATSAIGNYMFRVTPNHEFAAGNDFGFIPSQSVGLAAAESRGLLGRSGRGDFVEGPGQLPFHFVLDPLPSYRLRFGFGDPLQARSQTLTVEGSTVDSCDLEQRKFYVQDYEVAVSSDGILDIVIRSDDSQPGLVNFLVVTPTATPIPAVGTCSTTGSLETEGRDPPAWLDVFPESNAPAFEPVEYPITCSQQFTTGTDWNGLDERQVFDRQFSVHASDSQRSYEYRLGKGSQLYSFRIRDASGRWIETVGTQGDPQRLRGRRRKRRVDRRSNPDSHC